MTLFDMFNKAAGLTEDAKKYNTGDISEKTGLQKQPDGSWKPPKAKGSQPKGTEKKAKDMTYKEAAPKLNEKQKELLNNMAKQNGKSVEEVFETFKDIIGFGEYDPKLAEELDRNTRFEQEKLAKKRQKEEEELRQQRQEGEAAARAFKEKVEKGEIVYNEKTGQFEDGPAKANKPLTRTEATERVFQNHIKEFKDIKKQYSKLPRKELERVYSHKVSRTNSVETLPKGEIAEALTQHEMLNKYSGEIRELLKKPENTSDSAPLTADTKIKLSQIKTTDDAKRYNIGDISEKTGLQKTANGWVKPKKQKTSVSSKTESAKLKTPSPDELTKWGVAKYGLDSVEHDLIAGIQRNLREDPTATLESVMQDIDMQADSFDPSEQMLWEGIKEDLHTKYGQKKNATEKKPKSEKIDKNPLPPDVGYWADTKYKVGTVEHEFAMNIYEALEDDALQDMGQLLHDIDLQVETFDKDEQQKWQKVKSDFIKEFKLKQKTSPQQSVNKNAKTKTKENAQPKTKAKETQTAKDYGNATFKGRKVIDRIEEKDLEVPYEDFFVSKLKEGLSVDDALDELLRKKVVYYAGSRSDPKKEKLSQYYRLTDRLKELSLTIVGSEIWRE